jgi:hypothetical protein
MAVAVAGLDRGETEVGENATAAFRNRRSNRGFHGSFLPHFAFRTSTSAL